MSARASIYITSASVIYLQPCSTSADPRRLRRLRSAMLPRSGSIEEILGPQDFPKERGDIE
jgi:hypothetical protein